MHPPSPQLLRALRTSLFATKHHNVISCGARWLPSHLILPSPLYHTVSGGNPERLIPRAQPTRSLRNGDRELRLKEHTQTDLTALDVLGNIPAPATAVDTCLDHGFLLNNGIKVTGGDGILLVGGEVFSWRPWDPVSPTSSSSYSFVTGKGSVNSTSMVNPSGQFEVMEEAWGLFGLVWPRPNLLILGLGASVMPISPGTRRHINSLGIRVEIQDTRNAAAQFNLLATERGVTEVAAAMIPVGWNGAGRT